MALGPNLYNMDLIELVATGVLSFLIFLRVLYPDLTLLWYI